MDVDTNSSPDVPSLEDLPVTGAAKGIGDFLAAFGGYWPPRPSFDWPACLKGYHKIWEDSTTKIKEIDNPEKFRVWMTKELNEKVDLEAVLEELRSRMRLDDPVVLGLQGCLQVVVCFYRWGALPTNEEERARTKLTIPEQLMRPFTMISELFGTTPSCCIFNLSHACAAYDSMDGEPVGRHFWWNSDPEIRQSENNFFSSFVSVDNAFQPCMKSIRDYLILTNAARANKDLAESLFPKRVEKMQELRRHFLHINKLFINSIQKKDKVDKNIFPDYIQNMAAWGLDGVGGASGAEALTFSLLDEFFDLSGESAAYVGAYEKRGNMTQQARVLLGKMAADHREDRFDSFLGLDPKEDPLVQAKDEILHSIYIWRLGHARSSTEYMEKSKITASKIVETSIQKGESIAERGLFMGQIRARETAQKITNRAFNVPDLDAPSGY